MSKKIVTRIKAKDKRKRSDEKDKQKLMRMGVFTALAITIHNFPEGLATFASALHDPSLGIAIAIAVAILIFRRNNLCQCRFWK